ncbi:MULTISPECIES: type I secretion system permease/ATPase [Comamonas]|uniref:Cyclolysin secretion/processing ATP-binding protein CyaB n=1 Tax=Comamonas thiooxydans TaxID=363952 RepID=A0AA42TTE9_9BURK|nr:MULTISPECIES: type I secretion system permease/ATPase [Comamonas]KKI13856.1 ABC transporter [Comamonas thiooxydans]MDH1335536.1 type I secretion system permease/ATPase [Comamonas thiooxydans]MDH1741432.1 type I secretion system permease/ATPase [Comamonas thiooxydans]MDH1788003.1 type I secretion system permease/ATPase [Comamonas thiooxydans]
MPAHETHADPLLDCLVQLTNLHGKPYTAQALSNGLPLVDQRLTPSLLARAAARAQFSTRIVQRSLDAVPQGLLPAILILHGDRACLLLRALESGRFLLQYPESESPVEVEAQALLQDYAGLMCFVRPQFRFEPRSVQQGMEPRSSHWFWAVILENRRLYRDALLAAVLINVFALAMPLFSMNVYDRVVPNNAVETLWVLAIGISLVLIFNFVLTTTRAYVVDAASKRVDVQLSAQIMERVLDLRMESRPASVGSFAANLRSFESVRDFIASASLTTLVDLPFVLLFLVAIAWVSPWMLIPPVVAIAAILLVSFWAQARMESLTLKTFQASSQRNALLVESLTNLEAVKTLNAQSGVQRLWESSTQYIAYMGGKIKFISSGTVNFVQTLQQLVTIAVVVIGVYQVQDASLSMGGIIAASMIAGRCLAPFGQVAGLMMQFHNARTSLNSIDNYMKMPVEHEAEREFVSRPDLRGAIEFRNVSFSYPGSEQASLSGVSFSLRPGERVGIIGRIGSGKTTLEKLVLGLYQPSEGSVLIDGMDARQIDPVDLRRAIGHVPQDPMLFYGSLKHNLLVGAPFADETDMLHAARIAGVDDFAARNPKGYDMLVGERGESLSGGQRQSIAVARALINDPAILLLDEPSSNLDNQSEAQLKRRLEEASQGKTILLVTHRTALLTLVDRLIVIDGGRIVADGAKDQVIEALKQGRIGGVGGRA